MLIQVAAAKGFLNHPILSLITELPLIQGTILPSSREEQPPSTHTWYPVPSSLIRKSTQNDFPIY